MRRENRSRSLSLIMFKLFASNSPVPMSFYNFIPSFFRTPPYEVVSSNRYQTIADSAISPVDPNDGPLVMEMRRNICDHVCADHAQEHTVGSFIKYDFPIKPSTSPCVANLVLTPIQARALSQNRSESFADLGIGGSSDLRGSRKPHPSTLHGEIHYDVSPAKINPRHQISMTTIPSLADGNSHAD
ncbi:hypothetical protein BD410DRAFT_455890 [Rickenella mellea]|uniref:Uncharacterized protein n=1 Tax=Rickenella mellea TaxID=50990 RepID=A0A4Y7PVH2_9AGAM|nr:hypothetical protein BD410DRAFT_455890 [Rickenella mellea]